jgi:hypothetical protein
LGKFEWEIELDFKNWLSFWIKIEFKLKSNSLFWIKLEI